MKSIFVALVFVMVMAVNSFAAITLPTELSTASYETFMGLVLAALAVLWVGRKLVKTTNRS